MITLAEILALPAELRAGQNTQAITDALNADTSRTEVVEYWLTDRGMVVDLIAMNAGDTAMSDSILDKFNTMAGASLSVKAQVGRLYSDAKGLNFGDPFLRGWIAQMTPSVFTEAERDALLALAVKQKVVSEFEVRCVCWSDNGQWLA